MQQHLITIDLDGTALNNESRLSELTLKTLRQLDQMGHIVAIVTGRPFRTSIDIYHQLGIDAPMVNFNGALCQFPGRPDWLPAYHSTLDKEIAFELFAHQSELNIDLIVAEGRNEVYTTSLNLPDSPFYPKESMTIARLSRQELTNDPTAIQIFSEAGREVAIKKDILERYGDYVSIRTYGGELPALEVVRNGIHKAVGVKAISDFYHIPIDHILSFGDENNDLEMIQYAGHGIAMKNAIAEIKAVANDQTTYTNDEDGVARYLIDFFQLNF